MKAQRSAAASHAVLRKLRPALQVAYAAVDITVGQQKAV